MNLSRIMQILLKHPLSSENKLKVMSRFLSWQIARRILDKPVIIDWVNHIIYVRDINNVYKKLKTASKYEVKGWSI